ncbi:hypothetical protein MMC18_002683 [Xylographa bjoerkii]|nr:hypothetical protein [Xylographa bjoerkii]
MDLLCCLRRGPDKASRQASPLPLPEDDKPRQSPPPATPVKFPCHEPKELSCYAENAEIDLLKLYSPIRKLGHLKPKHVSALNLKINRDVSLDQLFPEHYLPSSGWGKNPGFGNSTGISSASVSATSMLRNGTITPGHQAYHARMKELLADNEDAYRAINRRPPRPGRSAARPAHLRKFYIALQIVGEFWDTSLDGPAPSFDDVTNAGSSPHSAVVTDEPPYTPQSKNISNEHQSSSKLIKRDYVVSQSSGSGEPYPNATSKTSLVPASHASIPIAPSPPRLPSPAEALSGVTQNTYTGRRTSTGSQMPAQYRHNLLKEFLEPILWVFGCRYETPRTQPHLYFRNLRIPVDLSGVVYCNPKERPSSIIGSLEGPLLGIQGRHNTMFGEEDGQSDVVDLLREVGAMLLIAQERSREGMDEVIPNVDKWFVTKPRWGGGTGEAIGEPLRLACDEDVINQQGKYDGMSNLSEELPTKKRSQEKRAKVEMNREAAKKENLRKSTMPPSTRWDSRIKYERIGKDAESEFDNIYLISSVNHHVCIVRLLVHPAYLSYLANGGDPLGQPWFQLQMDRSKWFDLLVVEDRIEAMKGIWGVLAWLMRA